MDIETSLATDDHEVAEYSVTITAAGLVVSKKRKWFIYFVIAFKISSACIFALPLHAEFGTEQTVSVESG